MDDSEQYVDDDAPTLPFERPHHRPVAGPVGGRQDGLWDANDVAPYLKVSRSWVYHRAEAGLLACVRSGSLLRFDPELIRAVARGTSAAAVSVRASQTRRG